MKKVVSSVILVVMTMASISAQNIFFPTKEGLTLVYANLDAKGKADSYVRRTIRKVEGSDNNLSISYITQTLDKNHKPVDDNLVEVPYTATISNGVLELDMKSFATSRTKKFIEIEGDKIRIPSTLAPGDKLDDAKFILTVNMGFKIKVDVSLTEQECLVIEEVTVPAGTFKCYKVTQTSTAAVMRKTITNKIVTWYAPGIGSVKSETYNEKGKLQTTVELQSQEG